MENKNDELLIKLDNSIKSLLRSAREFKKENENISNILLQLAEMLDNIDKTLEIIEKNFQLIIKNRESGKFSNNEIIKKFVKPLENLIKVIENIENTSNNLKNEIENCASSIPTLKEITDKLKIINIASSTQAIEEFKIAYDMLENNRKKLDELIDKTKILKDKLENLLLQIDDFLNKH
ncbi:conserved hypothetical protein [Methanocaldococcus sp. FS406-22]|uniref:hypothetical protein n=1 Tax=Methanocaldococcus sp. (strain FS406-22) TaxID=644281 RepID=UPI0001BF0987|nr:hypothetical protein [Methanocaldococcus sp. FS406-22]ADC69135.1 conserved hypothetical protein [Methanocaldococcus sp. FS406-22]